MIKVFFILFLSALIFPFLALAAGNGQACAPCGRAGDAGCSVGSCSPMWGGNYCIPANAWCFPNPLETTTLDELFGKISDILFVVALAMAPIFIVLGGLFLILGGQNPAYLEKAKTIFKWTGIGLLVTFLSKAIVYAIKGLS